MTDHSGRRYILTTRPEDKFVQPEVECCFDVINMPVTSIAQRKFDDAEIRRISEFGPETVVFTSETGAGIFFKDILPRLKRIDVDYYGIGPATCGAVRKNGVECTCPEKRDSEGLAHLLIEKKIKGQILLFRSGQANKILDETLRERGVSYMPVKAYDVVSIPARNPGLFLSDDCFGIAFTSAMEVESFLKSVKGVVNAPADIKCKIFSIGKYTTERLLRKGFTISPPAGNSDFTGLLENICKMYC